MARPSRTNKSLEDCIADAIKREDNFLGIGAFGAVYKVKQYGKGDHAVKVSRDISDMEIFKKENAIHVHLSNLAKSENFNHIIEHLGNPEIPNRFVILMEFAENRDVHQVAVLKKTTKAKVQKYFEMMINGIAFMHEKGIAHCDIKAQNLLLTKNDVVKLCDFGRAYKLKSKNDRLKAEKALGTLNHAAPELFSQKKVRGEIEYVVGNSFVKPYPLDIWAAGIVLLKTSLQTNNTWEDLNGRMYRRWEQVTEKKKADDRGVFSELDDQVFTLLKKMLCEQVSDRATLDVVKKSAYFKLK